MRSKLFATPGLRGTALSLLLVCAAGSALAGGIEDAFRGFVDRLRSKGHAFPEYVVGSRLEVTRPTLAKRVELLPLGTQQVAVFVTPGCRRCDQAVAHLRKEGTTYEVLDVSRSAVARDSFGLTEAKGFPALLVGNQLLTGWDVKLYQQAVARSLQDKLRQQQSEGGA